MNNVTLYFAPHQDDELLSMGISIIESAKKEDTHVILCTDGSKSNIRNVLNNKRFCTRHFGFHRYNLSKEDFTKARDREFIDSCRSLGISDSNMHVEENRTIDGALSIEKAKLIIYKYLKQYESVKVRTITPFGCDSQHSDHKNLGYAAMELYNEGKINDLEFFIEPYLYNDFKNINTNIEVSCLKVSKENENNLLNALNSYKLWKPREGRYCIGYHSTRSYFDQLRDEKECYLHRYETDRVVAKGEV